MRGKPATMRGARGVPGQTVTRMHDPTEESTITRKRTEVLRHPPPIVMLRGAEKRHEQLPWQKRPKRFLVKGRRFSADCRYQNESLFALLNRLAGIFGHVS